MSLYSSLLRPLAFRLDPERMHEIGMKLIQRGWMGPCSAPLERDPADLFGVSFPNRVGLAAGFDKNALAVDQWHRYGFGFVEIGTVTWHPQPGNPRPRLFRLPRDQAIINRMGFNNDGAVAVAERLARAAPKIPIGINLGKSKITDIDQAASDYLRSFRALRGLGAYYVVNVSSPNTPGLRALQDREPLLRILDALRTEDADCPLFVKIAPDLELAALDDVIAVAAETQLTGVIATNTTTGREGLTHDPNEAGGLSGRPVREKSNRVARHLAINLPDSMHLIGAGGVFTAADYQEKRRLGCALVQLYTGWVYGGPGLIPSLLTSS